MKNKIDPTTRGEASTRSALPWNTAAFIALVTLVAFWPAVFFDYVSFDDPDYVAMNATVRQGLTWEGVKWACSTSLLGHWHPLTWLSFMAGCQVFGGGPAPQHGINIVLHALNAALLFLAWWRLSGSRGAALIISALFALHPLHVESVAWVASRKDVLSGFFWMLALWFYAAHASHSTRVSMGPVAACLALGLLAKPTMLTLPFVLLLLDYWPLARWSPLGAAATPQQLPLVRLLLEKLPLFALSAGSVGATIWASQHFGVFAAAKQVGFLDRCGNALVSYVVYLWKTLAPSDLAPFYPHPGSWQAWQVGGAAVVLVMLTMIALSALDRAPWAVVGWLWFVGTLIPMAGFVQVGRQFMADRYTYLPLTGLFIVLVGVVSTVAKAWPARENILRGLSGVLIVACFLAMRGQLSYWRNSEILFTHTLAATRNNDVAHQHLGFVLREARRIPEARAHFAEVVRVQPNDADARNNLGLTLALEDSEALEAFNTAAQLDPKNAKVAFNQAMTLQALGRLEEALEPLRRAIENGTGELPARIELGKLLLKLGRVEEAVIASRTAVTSTPASVDANLALGQALSRAGNKAEAGAAFRSAAAWGSSSPEAQMEFGAWLAAEGNAKEAIDRFRQALRIRSDFIPALNNLAWLLATSRDDTLRNGAEAVRLAEQACGLTQHRAPYLLGTLAAAYAESGQFDQAVETATKAADLAEQSSENEIARRNRELREVYRSRQAWREP